MYDSPRLSFRSEESAPCLLHSESAPRSALRFALDPHAHLFSCSRLAHGGLLLLPEKVDGGVAVTLVMREESWVKGESAVSGRVRARGET